MVVKHSCIEMNRRIGWALLVQVSTAPYADWVHKSHIPHNRTVGMAPGVYGLEGRRAVFYGSIKDLAKGGKFKRGVPRSFLDGAWVDKKCLEVHGL